MTTACSLFSTVNQISVEPWLISQTNFLVIPFFWSQISQMNIVLASWNSSNGLIRATAQLSPGIVDYFMCHKVNIDGMEREHYFAYVRWFKKHPHKHCLGSFNSLCVWDSNNFESRGPSCFLPVHRIHSLFTGAHISVDNFKVMAVCPIPRRASILAVS